MLREVLKPWGLEDILVLMQEELIQYQGKRLNATLRMSSGKEGDQMQRITSRGGYISNPVTKSSPS